MLTYLGEIEERARREGQREALQDALLAIARSRFPDVPESFEARVRRLKGVDTLNRLIERAATAASVEEIWPSRSRGGNGPSRRG